MTKFFYYKCCIYEKIGNWIRNTWNRFWNWVKRTWRKIVGGVVIVSTIAIGGLLIDTNTIPSTIAEGQTIEFQYTDDKAGEDFDIYSDQQEYHSLRPFYGFNVYVAVDNKSGVDQNIFFQSYFLKDFTIENVYLLDETGTSSIFKPIYEEQCFNVASTTGIVNQCRNEVVGEEEVILLGVWNEIDQDIFSVVEYDALVKDKDIKIKDKSGDKVEGHIKKLSKKDKIEFYKLRIVANEKFTSEEFDIEVIGSEGGYGFLDPIISGYTDITPTMTGASAPSPNVASADSEVATPSHSAFHAFDKVEGVHDGNVWHSSTGAWPRWLKLDLGDGYEKKVTLYQYLTREDNADWIPLSWTFQGSNNDSDWDTLDTRTDEPNIETEAWSAEFNFENTTAYRYYKLNITKTSSSNGNKYATIDEFRMYIDTPVAAEEPQMQVIIIQ